MGCHTLTNKIIGLLFFGWLPLLGTAQQPLGNEWIIPSQTYFKVKVSQEGLYRLGYTALSNSLSAAGVQLSSVDPRTIQVFARGQQVPVYIEGEADGQFDAGDFMEWYATGNDGWLDAYLYDSPAQQPNKYYSNFNDTIAYYITWSTQPNANFLRLQPVNNNLNNLPPAERYFMHKEVIAFQNNWQGGKSLSVGGQYLYNSNFESGEGFTGPDFNKSVRTINHPVSNVYTGGGVTTAAVNTSVVSQFNQQHRIRFSINNNVRLDTVFSGEGTRFLPVEVPLSDFKNDGSPDVLTYEALGTGSSDRNALAYIEITYPRTFNMNNRSNFRMTLTGSVGSSQYLALDNFDHRGSGPILIDLANRQRIIGTVSGSQVRYRLTYFNSDTADIFITAQPGVIQVNTLEPVTFYDFSDPKWQGDYILVYHPKLKSDGQGNDWITEYIKYRRSAAGGNKDVVPLDINVLYDQFAYGIAKHPFAIKQLVQMAVNQWPAAPEHLFLIGKGLEYSLARTDQNRYQQNLIPTFGHPGSDYMLSTDGRSLLPDIAIGRITARNGTDVRIYLEKVRALEQQQNNPMQTVAAKSWMKVGLHLAGGAEAAQQQRFINYLNTYAQSFSSPYYGGDIVTFQKTSSDPIQYVKSQYLDSLINSGLSIITFFGHSSANSFDVSLDNPANYDNNNRYPLILSNGCFSGQIHGTGDGVSDRFIFAEDKGAIGFIASVSFGEENSLANFSDNFYLNLSKYEYNKSIGQVLEATFQGLSMGNPNPFQEMLVQQNSLHGDPAVTLNTHEKPDYALEAKYVSTSPELLTLDNDSFTVNIRLFNIGKAVDSTIEISIERELPGGAVELKTKEVNAPWYYADYQFTFPIDRINGVGINRFFIQVDGQEAIQEISEGNNTLTYEALIRSNEAIPVFPYHQSIVDQAPITLIANTANLQAPEKEYVLQIDTTMLFNSPQFLSTNTQQAGGVIRWTPPVTWKEDQVYYWRIAPAFNHPDSARWKHSSFLYKTGKGPGWNQSHYFQFTGNTLSNLEWDGHRNIKFVSNLKEVKVNNCIYSYHRWDEVARVTINDDEVQKWGNGSGVVVVVIDSITGLAWRHLDYNFGENGYTNRDYWLRSFHFSLSNMGDRANFMNMLDSIPSGNTVIVLSFQRPNYHGLKADSAVLGTSIFHKLRDYGAEELFYLDTLNYRPPWQFIFQKGNPNFNWVQVGTSEADYIDTTFVISGNWTEGYMKGTVVGPARQWSHIVWGVDSATIESSDSAKIRLDGLPAIGPTTRLFNLFPDSDSSLSKIQAKDYPRLQLETYLQDVDNRSAAQVNFWRIYYDPVGDASFDPAKKLVVNNDSLFQGEVFSLSTVIENVTPYPLDSLPIVAFVEMEDGRQVELLADTLFHFSGHDTAHVNVQFNTTGYSGHMRVILKANAEKAVLEQNYFNNQLVVPIAVNSDRNNPLLDVTFDGRHIMDGDLVSAKPEIRIQLKDDNPFLRLSDTTLMEVYITYPTGTVKEFSVGDAEVTFIPADSSRQTDNKAMLILRPEFKSDGKHVLRVRGRDESGNASSAIDYLVGFEVITKAMISRVLNYPNPFSTRTQFIFTLTGSEVPDNLRIQIMTISGKVVREISKEELGPLHIGINRTQYWWDGTDQYGDRLANGLYLYRVVAREQGKTLEHFAIESIDPYFESGYGKLYLAR